MRVHGLPDKCQRPRGSICPTSKSGTAPRKTTSRRQQFRDKGTRGNLTPGAAQIAPGFPTPRSHGWDLEAKIGPSGHLVVLETLCFRCLIPRTSIRCRAESTFASSSLPLNAPPLRSLEDGAGETARQFSTASDWAARSGNRPLVSTSGRGN